MSNGELWLMKKRRDAVWETVRRATDEDCYSFIEANLAIVAVEPS
jgi:hypothetical protein